MLTFELQRFHTYGPNLRPSLASGITGHRRFHPRFPEVSYIWTRTAHTVTLAGNGTFTTAGCMSGTGELVKERSRASDVAKGPQTSVLSHGPQMAKLAHLMGRVQNYSLHQSAPRLPRVDRVVARGRW